MVLPKYKLNRILGVIYFIILGTFLQIINIFGLILLTKIVKSPLLPYFINLLPWSFSP